MNLADLVLFHGSAAESVTPVFGLGNDHHDYGRGFYLTDDLALAKEWYSPKPGVSMKGFMPDWIGRFYALYQWIERKSSRACLSLPGRDTYASKDGFFWGSF